MTDDFDVENAGRPPYPDRLRGFLDALRVVVGQLAPAGQPPGFAAAIEAEEAWTNQEVRRRWIALKAALDAYPGGPHSQAALRSSLDGGVWVDLEGPLRRAIDLLVNIAERWQVHDEPGSRRLFIDRGQWAFGSTAVWHPIVPPIPEPGEHEVLAWARDGLEEALAHQGSREAPHVPLLEELDAGEPMAGGLAIPMEGGEDEDVIAAELAALRRPKLSAFVRHMKRHNSVTFTDASEPIYGTPYATTDRFRKTVDRVNKFLELKKSKIRYSIGSERVFKKISEK